MTSAVKRSVPPPVLVKMGNPLVRMLLGSPLHGIVDDSFPVLHLTGRKTGRRYDIPVGYADMGGRLAVVTGARWRVSTAPARHLAARRTSADGPGTQRRGP
jgi:hypothetical protein